MLAAFTHPSHIVIYAPGDSFTCRRAATRNLLGYKSDHYLLARKGAVYRIVDIQMIAVINITIILVKRQ
ncbi:hypothetical protein C5468_04745 [Photorhabdus luminescens subsp. mexicana]|uniref:Uncharacterized protein n=1 Tax=Photorhabdus luminescens subsp. mexicana TaxID=2100167 RepID=A0A4R4JJY3_PHOLU|nr:hypothetical protein C5468_04745 [Photorhabdus luminescens subsp. mexicana]